MKRILIVRLSAIGDVAMSTPIIPALHHRFPGIQISWLAGSVSAAILEENPRLHELIVLPSTRWKRLWKEKKHFSVLKEFLAFRNELQGKQFDCAIDLQGLAKSGFWARQSGAPKRIGLRSKEGSQFLMTQRVYPEIKSDSPISYQYEAIARLLGYDETDFPMDLHIGNTGKKLAQAYLAKEGLADCYAVIAPFTTRPQKHWFEENWVALAQSVINTLGLDIIALGGPGDSDAMHTIASKVALPQFHSICGDKADLRRSTALINDASLFVGVDTGLTHIAFGQRVPTVALFGSTTPYWSSRYEKGIILHDRLQCSPCDRHPTCSGKFTCMRNLSVKRVFAQCAALAKHSGHA